MNRERELVTNIRNLSGFNLYEYFSNLRDKIKFSLKCYLNLFKIRAI